MYDIFDCSVWDVFAGLFKQFKSLWKHGNETKSFCYTLLFLCFCDVYRLCVFYVLCVNYNLASRL